MQSSAKEIVDTLKGLIGAKYNILDYRLFGSMARGDSDADSDIDVFVRLDKVDRAIEEDIFDIAFELELLHDCVIDVIVTSEITGIPLYENIFKEGVAV